MRIILNKKRISNIIGLNELNLLTNLVSTCYTCYMMMKKVMREKILNENDSQLPLSEKINNEICEVSI